MLLDAIIGDKRNIVARPSMSASRVYIAFPFQMVRRANLAGLRLQFSLPLLSYSGVMRRLLWAKGPHEVGRYIVACLDKEGRKVHSSLAASKADRME